MGDSAKALRTCSYPKKLTHQTFKHWLDADWLIHLLLGWEKVDILYFVLVALATTSFIILGISTSNPVNAITFDALGNPTVVTDLDLSGENHPAKSVSCNHRNFCFS